MRFMIIVKATADSEAGVLPSPQLLAEMAGFHAQLNQAGVLLECSGLRPSAQGWRIHYAGGKPTLVDGPFAETKELIAGFSLIDVPSREAAQEWTRRFPAPFHGQDCEIEVRQLYEASDLDGVVDAHCPGPALAQPVSAPTARPA